MVFDVIVTLELQIDFRLFDGPDVETFDRFEPRDGFA